MKIIKTWIVCGVLLLATSCNKYLDIVPDNVATIDNAFTMRNTAEKFLFTCYSYLPKTGSYIYDPAVLQADEMWHIFINYASMSMVRGFQSIVSPYFDYWSGTSEFPSLFRAIYDCNLFLENIDKVPELDELERRRWISEVKTLKAYYHFYLLRMYGPIPIGRENIPVGSDLEKTNVFREPVDDCIDYIVQLLDDAVYDLPDLIEAEATELGRLTKVINLSIKAKVLILAASPLLNGNPDYASFKDKRGVQLFNSVYDAEKWKTAAEACKEAIDLAHIVGNKLYYYKENDPNGALVSERTNLKMNIRGAVTAKWNPEIIWSNPNNLSNSTQSDAQARLDGNTPGLASTGSRLAPTLKIVDMFYTKNGVPINEDKTWDYDNRFELKTATAADIHYIRDGYPTASAHFDREPRFYGSVAFDGSIWYGQGIKTETNNWYVQAKLGQYSGGVGGNGYSTTGYWPKKLVNPENVYSATVNYTNIGYPHPEIRLADLYLLYAEALNEYAGPSDDVYHFIDLVRERAGLNPVKQSWQDYSENPDKPTTKEGLREIIHQERAIELAFEGQRFWDLKRWKKAARDLTYRVQGWNIFGEQAEDYYIVSTIHRREFKQKDYFWPIKELELIINKNLVQNPGW